MTTFLQYARKENCQFDTIGKVRFDNCTVNVAIVNVSHFRLPIEINCQFDKIAGRVVVFCLHQWDNVTVNRTIYCR